MNSRKLALELLEDGISTPSSLVDAFLALEEYCSTFPDAGDTIEETLRKAHPTLAAGFFELLERFEELVSLNWYDDGSEDQSEKLKEAEEVRERLWTQLSGQIE